MVGNLNAKIEEEVWRDMARIADRMSRNPRVRVEPELARTRAHVLELKLQRQHQVEALRSWLRHEPDDQDAKRQLPGQFQRGPRPLFGQ